MEHTFPRSLVGNRIVSLQIRESSKLGYKISSPTHPGILYFCPQLKEHLAALKSLAEKLNKSSEDVIGLRIVEPAQLLVGLEEPTSVNLLEPTNFHWREHLDSYFHEIQETSSGIRNENRILTQKVDNLTKEYEKTQQELIFKNRENALLRMLVDSSSSKMGANHCDSCNCYKEDEDLNLRDNCEMPDTSMIASTSSDALPMTVNAKDLMAIDEDSSTPVDSTPPTPQPLAPNAPTNDSNKSEDLLWGVAQYIFCQLCPEQASDFKGMESHFMDAHVDKEKRNCSACPSETLHDIAGHVQQHTSRVYACEFCGKRGRKHFLKSHIRTHTGERPYSCETCGRCFADASTLRRHRLVHSGVKAHSCPICGIGIARKDNVKVHIRSHGRDAMVAHNLS